MSVTPVDNPSLKWKGPSSGGATVPIEYDVDDPTFCSPKSVLSGLASGFCERWAVTHPEFIVAYNGGNSTTLNWNDTNSSAAYRTSIVSNFVENIIVHDAAKMTMASAFCENNGDFMAPEHPTANSSANYMTFMDGMITQLITSGGYYVTSATNSPSYSAFNQLAASASANAPAASACELPVSNASAYTSQFLPAYPADWAKERKWMLEQLRYQKQPAVLKDVSVISADALQTFNESTGAFYSGRPGDSYTTEEFVRNGMSVLTSLSVNGGSDPHVCQSRAEGGFTPQGASLTAVEATTSDSLNSGAGMAAQFRIFGYPGSKVVQLPNRSDAIYPAFYYGMEASVTGQAGTELVDVYFGAPCANALGINDRISDDYGCYVIDANAGVVNNQSRIMVKDGGVVSITSGTVEYLCISAGGTASVGPNAWIQSCNVMSGGKLVPTGTSMKLGVLKADYRHIYGREDHVTTSSLVRISAGTGTFTPGNSSAYMAVSGALLTLVNNTENREAFLIVLGGATVSAATGTYYLVLMDGGVMADGSMTLAGSATDVQSFGVASGGTLVIERNSGGGCIPCVYAGGVLSMGGYARDVHIDLEHGGTVFWDAIYSNASNTADNTLCNSDGNGAVERCSMYMLHDFGMTAADGSVISNGWNSISTTVTAGGSCIIAGRPGSTPDATAKTNITGATYTNPYAPNLGYDLLSRVNDYIAVNAGVKPLAINGGTAKPVPVDLYPSFKLRQNQT